VVDRFVCVSQEINVQVRGDLFLKQGRRDSNRQTGRNCNRLKEGRKKKEIRGKGERNKLLLGFFFLNSFMLLLISCLAVHDPITVCFSFPCSNAN
jgi:hypothetical protein